MQEQPEQKAKHLQTKSAAEYAEMNVIRDCIADATKSLRLYFQRTRSGPATIEDERLINIALLRDAIVQFMACFNKYSANRHKALIPSEAFRGINGWEAYNQWLLDLRDSYAAHNFGVERLCEVGVTYDPDTGDVIGVGPATATLMGIGPAAEADLTKIFMAALTHVESRITELKEKLLDEANALTAEERANLPDLLMVLPEPGEARTSRTKYRRKLRTRGR